MKEYPIIFSGPMVLAILEGRKFQTRRAIKQSWIRCLDFDEPEDVTKALAQCPFGHPGEKLWVREAWQACNTAGQWWHDVPRADRPLWNWAFTNPVEPAYELKPPRWISSIFMPRMAARILLTITEMRIERLQAIREEDALAEGFRDNFDGNRFEPVGYLFEVFWNSINAKRGYSWASNPWVWVISFTA